MDLEIDLTKSVEENAGIYYDLAKKHKRKLEGAKKALAESQAKLHQLLKQEQQFQEQELQKKSKVERKKEWYDKFHWFISSEGFLCIGGKDATSNEIIIKKHMENDDLVFHTEMSGSPFFLIKNGASCGNITKEETAQAVAVYSRAWKLQHTTVEVLYVLPEQVSKTPKAGEFLTKGSFIINGTVTHLYPKLEYAIGITEERIIGGPVNAIKSKTSNYLIVIPGAEKKSDLAKKIKAKLKAGELDDIISFLPAGGGEIRK